MERNSRIIALLVAVFVIAVMDIRDLKAQGGDFGGDGNFFYEGVSYRGEVFGVGGKGGLVPMWLVSNRWGVTPFEMEGGYAGAGVFYNHKLGSSFRVAAGLDLAGVSSRGASVFSAIRYVDDVPRTVTPNGAGVIVRQAFGELAFRSLLLTVGSKEEYLSPWDKELTSGDMVLSNNARALPGVRLSMPLYNPVPLTGGWVSVKGNFFVGRGFDALYMERYTRESGALYVHDVLWHYKAASLRVGAPGEDRGLSLTIGFQHGAQWGGVSNNPRIGAQPASLVDFARVVMGMGGGEGATASDSVNVLGNQYGSYDFKVSRKSEAWSLDAYHQHYFDDKSGTIFNNGWDGLWGVELYLHKVSWLRKVLVERLDTRNQTGPMHFLDFDHQKYPAVGGGADNYYNNGEYTTGVSYFNRGLGSPLLPSPEYNRDGSVGFKNTRVLAWHFGAAGDVSQDLAYRVLFTVSDSWGLPYRPLLDNKTGQSLLVELTYRPPRLEGWAFTLSAAADRGNILGEESTALAIHIVKTGILSTARMR